MNTYNTLRALLVVLALVLAAAPAHAQYRGDFSNIEITKGGITCKAGATCDVSQLKVTPNAAGAAGTLGRLIADKAPVTTPVFANSTRINGADNSSRLVLYSTNNLLRMAVGLTNDPEGTGNTGSNFNIFAYDNAGNYLSNPLTIIRQSGQAVLSGGISTPRINLSAAGSTGPASDFTAESLGGISRALRDFLGNEIYAANYGVKANDGLDDTVALQTAMNLAQDRGGELILPDGVINVCTSGDPLSLLRVTKLMSLRGSGRGTIIQPCASAGARTVLLIKPAALAGGIRGMRISDFSIGELGARPGGDGIRFDTTALHGFIAKPLVDNVAIGYSNLGTGYYALHHVNNPSWETGNGSGGLFGGTFQNSDLFGGVKFEMTGDSNNFLRNIVYGPNVGFDYEAISGAATHTFENNNVTAFGGAFWIKNSAQVKILRNQTESFHPYEGSTGALIALDNCQDAQIEDNNSNAYDRLNVVLLRNTSGTTVKNNTVAYSTAAGKFLAVLDGSSANNTIGRQRTDNDVTRIPDASGDYNKDGFTFVARVRPSISKNTTSIGNPGLFDKLTLTSPATEYADTNFYQGIFAKLGEDDNVTLRGAITTGIQLTPGTTIATLPPAYRPARAIRISADLLNESGWTRGVFVIDTAGAISAQNVPANYLIQFDGTSFARQ